MDNLTAAVKSAIYNLIDEIIAFVKAIFEKEVGTEIEDEFANLIK